MPAQRASGPTPIRLFFGESRKVLIELVLLRMETTAAAADTVPTPNFQRLAAHPGLCLDAATFEAPIR